MAQNRITRPNPTKSQEQVAKYRHDIDDYQHGEDDDPDPYVDLVQQDPVVCDTCFLLRYDVVSCDIWRKTWGWTKYERWESRPDASVRIPRGTAAQGTQLVCKNCGTAGEKTRPIPKHLISEYAENMSATLRTKGISHDPSVLLSEILRRNTSENQGRQDSHVFSPAVKRAIRARQTNSSGQPATGD